MPGKKGLENGISSRIASGMKRLHQQRKGQLVCNGSLEFILYLRQQVPKRLCGMKANAQRQGVDKVANDAGKGRRAPGPQHACHQVILTGVAMQERLKRGQHEIMDGNVVLAGQIPQGCGQRGIHRGQAHPGLMALPGRTGEVSGEIEGRGQRRQRFTPKGQMLRRTGVGQSPGLVLNEISILAAEFGRSRAAVGPGRRIKLSPFVGEQGQRPQIGDDVVHGQHQRVALRSQQPDMRPQERPAFQIEGLQGLRQDGLLQRILIPGCGIGDAQMHGQMFMDALHGVAVIPAGKGGAQGFVPGDDLVQGLLQRPGVRRIPDDHRLIDVVGHMLRLQLLKKPERALAC